GQSGVAVGVRRALRRHALAPGELLLALRDGRFALVERGHPFLRGPPRRVLTGGQILSEALCGPGELLLLRVELALPLRELLVAPRELRIARPQLLLPLRQTLVALLEGCRAGDRGLGRLALPRHLGAEPLALGTEVLG